jgi:ribosome-associated protein
VAVGDSEQVLRVSPSLVIPQRELRWTFSRSGGPGGQHANTADTRVEVRFDIAGSSSLTDRQRELLLRRYGPELRVAASEERSQLRNRDVAARRLAERLASGLWVARPRRPTRPGRGAVERRLSDKKRQSERKRQRRRPDGE